MAAINSKVLETILFSKSLPKWILIRITWGLDRQSQFVKRRLGLITWPFFLCIFLSLSACGINYWLKQSITDVRLYKNLQQKTIIQPMLSLEDIERKNLQTFDQILLPYVDIPSVLQQILSQAEADGLAVRNGEYRPQIDVHGNFVRYRISMPIKGNAHLIHRHIVSILIKQKAIALESVQFKRESGTSPDVDARIQWVLLTHLPVEGNILGNMQRDVRGLQ